MSERLLVGTLLLPPAGCSQGATSAPPTEPTPSIARWALDPAALPAPDDRSINVGVWEVPCSGGRDVTGKILPPEITYDPVRVVVTLWLEPLPVLGPNEALTCELAPPVPYSVGLSEPLGDREPPAAKCEPHTYCSQVWIRVVGTDATNPLPTTYELWVGEHAYRLTPDEGDGVASVDAPTPLRVRLLDAETCVALADFPADPGKYLVISIDDAANLQIQVFTGSSRELGPGLEAIEKPAC